MLTDGKKLFAKSLIGFLLVLFLIYILLGSTVHDIFVKNYMYETEKVIYLGKEYTRGILNWQVLRNHILIGVTALFVITFWINYLVFQKESKSFLNAVIQRIVDLKQGLNVDADVNFLPIDREVTELIEREDDLTKKIKAQFVDYNQEMMFLAHDLKTPLTVILGYVKLLLDNPELDDKSKEKYLQIVLESAHQLESLIDKFFELSRYSVQADLSTKQKIKLEDILAEIQESLYLYRQERGVTFENDFNDHVFVEVNPELFARALINIYKNAVKYSDPGSAIKTQVLSNDQGQVAISISNRFSGADQIDTDKMFHTFYKGANSLDGHGIGLPIAKTLIEKQDGTIDAVQEGDTMTLVVKL